MPVTLVFLSELALADGFIPMITCRLCSVISMMARSAEGISPVSFPYFQIVGMITASMAVFGQMRRALFVSFMNGIIPRYSMVIHIECFS